MTLIMQYNDMISSASLCNKEVHDYCDPTAMVRRHLVRGYNDQIYYGETSGNAEKIYKLTLHPSKIGEVKRDEIY